MYAVVSLLDERACAAIQHLWDELGPLAGKSVPGHTPFPHLSYHVAETYPLAQLEPLLAQFARAQAPFLIRTTGLGLFTGAQPVVFLPVVRTPVLARFHLALWEALAALPGAGRQYYHPEHWIPHITLTYGELCTADLSTLICRLGGRDLSWELTVDNLSVLYDEGGERGLAARFALGGGLTPEAEASG